MQPHWEAIFLCHSFSYYSYAESVHPSLTSYTFYIQTLLSGSPGLLRNVQVKSVCWGFSWVSSEPEPSARFSSWKPPSSASSPRITSHLSPSRRSNGFSAAVSLSRLKEKDEVTLSRDQQLEIFYTEVVTSLSLHFLK